MNNAKSRLRRTKRERQNNNRAHFNMFFRELDHLHHALSEAQSNLKHNRVAGLAQPLENLIEVIATLIAELQLEAQDYGQELTQDHEFIKTIALEYSCFEWVFQQENVTANSNQIKIYPPIIKNDETIAKHLKSDLKQFDQFLTDITYLETALTEAKRRVVECADASLLFSMERDIEDIETETEDIRYAARFWAGMVEHNRTLMETIEANYQGVDWVFDQCGLD